MISAPGALDRLVEGNRRFVSGDGSLNSRASQARRGELVDGQEPFAAIVSCSDSRVPPEIVFDQGLGDLFVIRVAGNIVTPPQLGSVEFAAQQLGTKLVVVLGHSGCGAVQATVQELEHPPASRSPNLGSIVDAIRPSVEPLFETDLRQRPAALLQQAVRANVRTATNQLRRGSQVLERLVQGGELLIVGAEYSLETGVVDFFDGLPAAAG